jgi:hypothetical protein
VSNPRQMSRVVGLRVKTGEEGFLDDFVDVHVNGFGKDERDVMAKALMKLLEPIVVASLGYGAVDVGNKCRDGRRRLGLRREAKGDGVRRDAFDKACWFFPWCRSRRERSRGSFQV